MKSTMTLWTRYLRLKTKLCLTFAIVSPEPYDFEFDLAISVLEELKAKLAEPVSAEKQV